MKNFKDLKVWEKAHNLTLEVYSVVSTFPRDERYGLTSQIKRSCVSIPANIAEGCGRKSDAELARFLQISMGSASEFEYHLLLSRDSGFLVNDDYQHLNDGVIEIKRMLSAFIKKLNAER